MLAFQGRGDARDTMMGNIVKTYMIYKAECFSMSSPIPTPLPDTARADLAMFIHFWIGP